MRSRERGGGDGSDELGGEPKQKGHGNVVRMGAQPSGLPTKLFFRIGEVASAVGVEAHVLRYWETEFRSIRPQKSARGQRVYSRRDVETLMRVRELLYDRGFTIAGARKALRDRGIEPRQPGDPTSESANRMRAALLDLQQEIAALLTEFGA